MCSSAALRGSAQLGPLWPCMTDHLLAQIILTRRGGTAFLSALTVVRLLHARISRTVSDLQPVNLLWPNPQSASKLAEKQFTLVIVRGGWRSTIWIRRRTTVSTSRKRGYPFVPMNSFGCVLRHLHQDQISVAYWLGRRLYSSS